MAWVSKDAAENGCKLIFKDIADKVRQGLNVSLPIPHVGTLRSRNSVVAVLFNDEVIREATGKTAKQFFEGKLFSTNNNKLNLEIMNQE